MQRWVATGGPRQQVRRSRAMVKTVPLPTLLALLLEECLRVGARVPDPVVRGWLPDLRRGQGAALSEWLAALRTQLHRCCPRRCSVM